MCGPREHRLAGISTISLEKCLGPQALARCDAIAASMLSLHGSTHARAKDRLVVRGGSSCEEENSRVEEDSSGDEAPATRVEVEEPAAKKQRMADSSAQPSQAGQQQQQQEEGQQQEQQEGRFVVGADVAEAEAVAALLESAAGEPSNAYPAHSTGALCTSGSPRQLQHDPAALPEFLALHAAFNRPEHRQTAMTASLRMLQCYRDAALVDPSHSEAIMAHTQRYAVLLRLLASEKPQGQNSITEGVLALTWRFLQELRSFRTMVRRNMQHVAVEQKTAEEKAEAARRRRVRFTPAQPDAEERVAAAQRRAAEAEQRAAELWLDVQRLQQASTMAAVVPGTAALQQQLVAAQTQLAALFRERAVVLAAAEYAVKLRQELEQGKQEAEAAKHEAWASAAALCRLMHQAFQLAGSQQEHGQERAATTEGGAEINRAGNEGVASGEGASGRWTG